MLLDHMNHCSSTVYKIKRLPVWSTMERRVALAVSALLIVWLSTKGSSFKEEINMKDFTFNHENHEFTLQRDGVIALSGNMGKNFDLTQTFHRETCKIPDGNSLPCFGSESVKFVISDEQLSEPGIQCSMVY